eukprot:scaffold32893_cov23-Tisochrysis_lutea.AAC.1
MALLVHAWVLRGLQHLKRYAHLHTHALTLTSTCSMAVQSCLLSTVMCEHGCVFHAKSAPSCDFEYSWIHARESSCAAAKPHSLFPVPVQGLPHERRDGVFSNAMRMQCSWTCMDQHRCVR